MKNLLIAGYVCSFVALALLPPAFGVAGLVIGIVVLAKGRIGHGIVIIILAITCGLAGVYTGYIGWNNLSWNNSSLQSSSTYRDRTASDWRITQVQSRITAKDSIGITFGWQVTVRNDSSTDGEFVGKIHFLDKDGFEINNDYFNLGDHLLVAPHSEHTFVGSTFFYDQQNPEGVAKVTATARRERL